MLLAVDVGNTNIVLGVLDDEKMVCSGRLSTNVNETEIEYSMKLKTFLEVNGVKGIDGAIISSVVPALVRTLMKSVKLVCAVDAVVVGPGIKTGLNIKLDNPAEMGADIVVGDVAVINKYPLPAIVFDFGTATTASVIDKTGAHIGGAIMCGVKTAINSLSTIFIFHHSLYNNYYTRLKVISQNKNANTFLCLHLYYIHIRML